MTTATEWAQNLGLAISPLFSATYRHLSGEHFALLDGRRASFACSIAESVDISQEQSRSWQWSADLAHHVLITPAEVLVRSGRESVGRKFSRDSVNSHLEQFLIFLDDPHVSALPDVVPFLIEEFRQMWAITGEREGQQALTAFLFALHAAEGDMSRMEDPAWRQEALLELGIDDPNLAPFNWNPAIAERARGLQARSPMGLRLIPSLVLRHAAGRLFQEAHAILESVQHGLWGDHTITTAPAYFPGGAYFTPVRIARLLAEWALQHWSTLPDKLTVADFACGSAVFLTEAARALERIGFRGTVELIGRDKSVQAITMAKVAVRTLESDMPTMQITSDIRQADALEADWPKADIVLMNPPFRSWEQMSTREREWVHEVTKGVGRGRPDLSVGFVERAVSALRTGGVVATLVPAGVLASDGLAKWRNGLLQKVTPDLIAVLGEHGLFQHALVNVGILAFRDGASSNLRVPLHVAWSSAEDQASSRAIRGIRRLIYEHGTNSDRHDDTGGWSVTVSTLEALNRRPSWLPGAGTLGPLVEEIQEQAKTTIGEMFHVHEGIKTGAKRVFVQPSTVVKQLPSREQQYFKEAVEGENFLNGEIKSTAFLFVADEAWETWEDVEKAVPRFFERYLKHESELLSNRKADQKVKPWQLTRRRTWPEGKPRLLSKRFGLYPAFARDPQGRFAVVQAYAWAPTDCLAGGLSDDELREILTAYWWFFNSRIAVAVFREYCPNVAGGQLDLARKFVTHAPIPDLRRKFSENPALQVLSSTIRTTSKDNLPELTDRDRFAAAAFETDLNAWNLSGLQA